MDALNVPSDWIAALPLATGLPVHDVEVENALIWTSCPEPFPPRLSILPEIVSALPTTAVDGGVLRLSVGEPRLTEVAVGEGQPLATPVLLESPGQEAYHQYVPTCPGA
jgi:hypothetical protein